MPKLQETQYGFKPQRGTEDAFYDLMTYIYKELNLKKIEVRRQVRRLRFSSNSQCDLGSESDGRENHIRCYDRAYSAVRFACLGTDGQATEKVGVRKMLNAVQRTVALKACRAHCTVCVYSALILSRLLSLDIKLREVDEVKRGKDLEDTFVDWKLGKPTYFGDLPHPAHVLKIRHESVEDLDTQTLDRIAVFGLLMYTD
ncbi:hypothetical protein EVAR_84493_1 [Eumeta japonica]|uniref:Uncharacterized protein n=1 Tax=Eumeta variegata TaxID=151549 RepID=A0A4C1UHP2_EUMVA|nr:hypothetical protein EVAR_84493_1 [Eumeta japonica]